MITEPEPTDVMPTSRPPRAPTRIGRDRPDDRRRPSVRVAAWHAGEARCRAAARTWSAASSRAKPMHIFRKLSSSSGRRRVHGPHQVAARATPSGPSRDQPLGQLKLGEPSRPVHDRAAGLVDGRRRQVGGDDRRGVADAEEDQRGRHQRAAAHPGDADDGADDERRDRRLDLVHAEGRARRRIGKQNLTCRRT